VVQNGQNPSLDAIARLLENLPPDEVAYYEDEVDIHLNPKIVRLDGLRTAERDRNSW